MDKIAMVKQQPSIESLMRPPAIPASAMQRIKSITGRGEEMVGLGAHAYIYDPNMKGCNHLRRKRYPEQGLSREGMEWTAFVREYRKAQVPPISYKQALIAAAPLYRQHKRARLAAPPAPRAPPAPPAPARPAPASPPFHAEDNEDLTPSPASDSLPHVLPPASQPAQENVEEELSPELSLPDENPPAVQLPPITSKERWLLRAGRELKAAAAATAAPRVDRRDELTNKRKWQLAKSLRLKNEAEERKYGVRIAASKIPNAGKGLFAAKPFKKGDLIAAYTGKLIRTADRDPLSKYTIQISKEWSIDATDPSISAIGRYVNTGRGTMPNNARYVVSASKKTAVLKATKSIAVGAEILAAYGQGYHFAEAETKEPAKGALAAAPLKSAAKSKAKSKGKLKAKPKVKPKAAEKKREAIKGESKWIELEGLAAGAKPYSKLSRAQKRYVIDTLNEKWDDVGFPVYSWYLVKARGRSELDEYALIFEPLRKEDRTEDEYAVALIPYTHELNLL